MARMLPELPSDATQSQAEVRVFNLIRSELSDEWTALHSLGIGTHRVKPWAEIDFVLIGPEGVYCLEVKGGRVARHSRVWEFTNRHGKVYKKSEGPFDQVGGAAAALRNYLLEHLPPAKDVIVGYGVVMPDVVFKTEGPDILHEVLCDERHVPHFSQYVSRLIQYWKGRIGRKSTVASRLRRSLSEILVRDFHLTPSLRTLVGLASGEMVRLTEGQFRVLDEMQENRRLVVRGGAGTGKTLLALEEARRRGERGESVFLSCFNRNLAMHLKRATTNMRNVRAFHLHGFMEGVLRRAGIKSDLPELNQTDLLEVYYPRQCCEALIELDEAESIDTLVIDEGQDLLMPPYLDVFDTLLRGGLRDGEWRIFLDHSQDIFGGTAVSVLRGLEEFHPAHCTLTINCRNTAPIALAAGLISGADTAKTLVVEGPSVEHRWYADAQDQRRKVSRFVGQLLSQELAPEQIVILSPYTLINSCLAAGLKDVPCPLEVWEGPESRPRTIRFSTVSSFKGLEADAVALVDIDDLESPARRQLVYVGASRARAVLGVFMRVDQKDLYQERAGEFGARSTFRVRPSTAT